MTHSLALRSAILTVALAAAAATAPAASAAVDDAPTGYRFCGWQDFGNGWTYDTPEPGAFTVAFADGMTCRAARRNVERMTYSSRPPYRPLRKGYRCTTLKRAIEYSDVRCVRRGGGPKFRVRSGS